MSLEFQLAEVQCKIISFEKKLARVPDDSETMRVLRQLKEDEKNLMAQLIPVQNIEPETTTELESKEAEPEIVETQDPEFEPESQTLKTPAKKAVKK